MSSNFVSNAILLNNVNESRIQLPSDSKSIKLYWDGESLKYVNFAGEVFSLDKTYDGKLVIDEAKKLIKTFVKQLDSNSLNPFEIQSLAAATNELVGQLRQQLDSLDLRDSAQHLEVTSIKQSIDELSISINSIFAQFSERIKAIDMTSQVAEQATKLDALKSSLFVALSDQIKNVLLVLDEKINMVIIDGGLIE